MAVTLTYTTTKGTTCTTEQEALVRDVLEQKCITLYSHQLGDVVLSITEHLTVFPKDSKEIEIRNMCHRRRKEDAFPELLEPVEIPSLLNTEIGVG